ncbi:MAG: penicillin-binding protein 1B [Gammaproteobacteria bacterium]|uniref:Penicillin-binding protein 1B n=1 Tax=Candidatus Thiopontia autotrophica TaxID=2841688 RepID=A0A8J6TQK0_9GAMM|nr:penicillin-binding protein 1B [Candidatus Thiopontia autotrophica]
MLLRRLFQFGTIVLLPILLLYTLWLDFTVRDQFEGKRWELPARVYASPLELYAGKTIDADQLVNSLDQLGYQKKPGSLSRNEGSYLHQEDTVSLHSRRFHFWDGIEKSRQIRVSINRGKISRIVDLIEGDDVGVVRLDPLPIGSFYPSHGEDRILLRLEDVPDIFVRTLTTVEDRSFYDHIGVSPAGMARALFANLRAGKAVQGGSTLTQQLAKNMFLTRERTLWRKFQELLITFILESNFQKSEILEAYLNEVYFGQDQRRAIHGVGMASRFFFGHDAGQLTLAKSALLVGMLKGPSWYNPRRHPERAKQRRNMIVDLLLQQGEISENEAVMAKHSPLGVLEQAPSGESRHPAFLDLVRRQILRDYNREDLVSAGLQIFTTLNPEVQSAAEESLRERIGELKNGGKRNLQGAVVVISPDNGEVEAIVGGRDSRAAGFNRALNAVRPIGSLVKPAIYLTALEQPERYTLITPLVDRPFELGKGKNRWRPMNYDRKYHGDVQLHRALSHSYNLSTARLGVDLGVGRVAHTLKRLGVERDIPRYPSIFLGSLELSPLDVAKLYQPLAGGGVRSPLRSIRAVMNRNGAPLNRYPLHLEEVASPKAIALLQWGMQQVVRSGTARYLNKVVSPSMGLAGKTGTTDELRDSWFAGFSGDRLAVIWMGRDDNNPAGLTGSSGALRVWGKLMSRLPVTPLNLLYPEGVVKVWVDADGSSTARECPDSMEIPFIEGSEPNRAVQCGANG